MDDTAALLEIEAIKALTARYCRYLDTKQWRSWREIFTDDFVGDTFEAGGEVIAGADAFVSFTRKNIGKPSQPTVHQVHAPEIELTSDTPARGVWALNDVVRLAPGLNLNGYGHYHETYEKGHRSHHRRLRPDRQALHRNPAASPPRSGSARNPQWLPIAHRGRRR